MDRALSRLALDRGGPRDLAAIGTGLTQAATLATRIAPDAPARLVQAAGDLLGHDALVGLLGAALADDLPLLTRDGGFIAPGHDGALDEARQLRDEGRGVIARMQAEYAALAGVQSRRSNTTTCWGYFIETTATHAEKMLSQPLSDTFIHRQTTANQVRFTTVPLSEIETKILNAGNHALEIEKRLYEGLRQAVLDRAAEIAVTARALAEIDLATAFADLASGENWCEPQVDDSRAFNVTAGRHPVVERALRRTGAPFIANDCRDRKAIPRRSGC